TFPDADVVFRSSDGKLIHVHTGNLQFGSDAFPPTIRPQKDEIVDLPEDFETLEVVFRFVYPKLLPDLEKVNFRLLYNVAEAVEKYEVHIGKKMCCIFMKKHATSSPLHVLDYSIKHGYPEIANSAAPHLKFVQLTDLKATTWVTRELFALWMPYYYHWEDAVRSTVKPLISAQNHKVNEPASGRKSIGQSGRVAIAIVPLDCPSWPSHQKTILSALTAVSGPDWTIAEVITVPEESAPCYADVVFRSSDGKLFHVHTKNLEFGSEGFPPAGIRPQNNEIVDLSEDSTILELLFSFMYPKLLPDLGKLDFNTLSKLSEAVEKYEVHITGRFLTHKRQNVTSYPLHVLNYAVKHAYPAIANSAAPHLKFSPLAKKEIVTWVTREVLELWMLYYHQWVEAVRSVIEELAEESHATRPLHTNPTRCAAWTKYQREIIANLSRDSGPDWTIAQVIAVPEGALPCCEAAAKKWRTELARKLKDIPPFVKV
ncbi:hypothetical protein H0H93_002991, partial [Arthromyces matolae]